MIPSEPPPPRGIVDLDENGWDRLRAQQRGRVVVVNFWATWCEPCREEFPNLVRLHNTYRGHGLSVVAISMDEPESDSAIEQFLKSQGANFGSYRQRFKDFEALVNSINPRWGGGIPATFLYDREGRLVESWQGATTFAEFERAVKPLLRLRVEESRVEGQRVESRSRGVKKSRVERQGVKDLTFQHPVR